MLFDQLEDYEKIILPGHYDRIWDVISGQIPKYFESYAAGAAANANRLFGGVAVTTRPGTAGLPQQIEKAKAAYNAEAIKYRDFFDPECLEEYESDPKQFARSIGREVPVLRKALNSQREEMLKWRMLFRQVQSQKPEEYLRIFTNQIELATGYPKDIKLKDFSEIDAPEDFGFGELDEAAEDERVAYLEGHHADDLGRIKYGKYQIAGVVNLGIISTVLYYFNPGYFPRRGRQSLAGLYYLSEGKYFSLPSQTTEFLLYKVNEHGSKIEHNFYYPYSLFTLYSLRLARALRKLYEASDIKLPLEQQFILTNHFLEHVAECHKKDMKDWVEHEDE